MKVADTSGSKLNQHPFGGIGTRIGQQTRLFLLEQKKLKTLKNNS
jgi:hypothetical protein